METGEIDAQKRIYGPWHYDSVADFYNDAIADAKKMHKFERQELSDIENTLKNAGPGNSAAKNSLELKRKQQVDRTAYRRSYLEAFQRMKTRFNITKPFLIGPATLDSLAEEEPDNYDYIDAEQLPFDNLFFDILRPVPIGLPFLELNEGKLIGLEMHTWKDDSQKGLKTFNGKIERMVAEAGREIVAWSRPYEGRAFLESTGRNRLQDVVVNFRSVQTNPGLKRHTYSWGSYCPENGADVSFEVNPLTDKVDINIKDVRDFGLREVKAVFYDGSLSDPANGEAITKIPRLCINLVNYINSHNITVVSRTRKPRKVLHGGQFIEEPSSRNPFHLITLKSGEVEETRESNKSWELNWRVYVRGHTRRFRDNTGRIYLISWTHPHVRGPENAPWREQRYEVLAKKLEEERTMYKELGA